jgi:hypothetical protein
VSAAGTEQLLKSPAMREVILAAQIGIPEERAQLHRLAKEINDRVERKAMHDIIRGPRK